jgi:hypothetical protein
MVVPGAVGGVSGQEVPSQFGGAKKGRKGKKVAKGKKRGGAEDNDDNDSVYSTGSDGGDSSAEKLIASYVGGAKRGAAKRRQLEDTIAILEAQIKREMNIKKKDELTKFLETTKTKLKNKKAYNEYMPIESSPSYEDLRKFELGFDKIDKNLPKHVKDFYHIRDLIISRNLGDESIKVRDEDIKIAIKLINRDRTGEMINFRDTEGNDLLYYTNLIGFEDIENALQAKKKKLEESESKGGAKKDKKKSKGKKRGGNEGCVAQYGGEDQVMGVAGEVNQQSEPALVGGAKKGKKGKKDKKRGGGGAEVEAFNAVPNPGAPLGGFDTLLVDLKKQVGGKYKNKGGAFKLYARELSALSKKLQKLV